MTKRQSSKMFVLALMIWGTIFVQMAVYVISLAAGWNVKFNLVEVCHSTLKAFGLSSLQYLLDALVIYTLLFSLWKMGSQLIHTYLMKRRFQQYRDHTLSTEMNEQYPIGKDSIVVISYPAPIAITMGLMSPKIIISTGLMNLLTKEELHAVIFHEMYHKSSRDPLKIFLLSLFASTMPYFPILKWFNQKYRIIQEVLADELAISEQETSVNIGSALLKMLKVGKIETMSFAYAAFTDTTINYRIEYILNPVQDIQLKVPVKTALTSCFVFSLICVFFIYALA